MRKVFATELASLVKPVSPLSPSVFPSSVSLQCLSSGAKLGSSDSWPAPLLVVGGSLNKVDVCVPSPQKLAPVGWGFVSREAFFCSSRENSDLMLCFIFFRAPSIFAVREKTLI